MNRAKNSTCLLLNADFTPLKIISWQKAIVWSLKFNNDHSYAIEIIKYYADKYIRGTGDKTYPVPSVAKTMKYFNIYNRSLKFSRKNLFLRDNYTCQYCGNKLPEQHLTYDHIIPKSRCKNKIFSTNWNNIVASCYICNKNKRDRTPEEANMYLLKEPKIPQYHPKYLPLYSKLANIEYVSDWQEYMPKEYFNEI
jgi:5-methylcytosine-specific restriction endonuclease McrA